MQFRRRRLLPEGTADLSSRRPASTPAGEAELSPSTAHAYTDAARSARERAVCTLLPARLLTVGLAAGICLALVGACLGLDLAVGALASWLPAEELAFLQIDEPRSLGHWLASTLLAASAVVALFIYSLRRHRIDDYHGRYRVWIWISIAGLIASLAETTDLGRLAWAASERLARWSSLRADVVPQATFGLLATGFAVRLLFEIRKSRLAVAALVATVIALLVPIAAQADWTQRITGALDPAWARASSLAGYVFLLTTLLLYARYVQLGVTGAIVVAAEPRRAKPKRAKKRDTEPEPQPTAKPQLKLRTDLEPPDFTAAKSTAPCEDEPTETDAESLDMQRSKKHLSKSERRRMRREARTTKLAS